MELAAVMTREAVLQPPVTLSSRNSPSRSEIIALSKIEVDTDPGALRDTLRDSSA